MKRLKILNDNVLGLLLRVALGFQKKTNGVVQFTFYKNQVALAEQFEYTLLQKIGLLESKTVLSPRTLAEGNYHKDLLIQKSQAALIGSMHSGEIEGIKSLRKQAEETELFLKHLERKYGVFDKGIDYKDSVRITKDFSNLDDTLGFCLTFNPKQIAKLKSYLKRYWLQYANRDLAGQEKLALPNLYTAPILVKFNNPNYVKTYGKKRLSIEQDNFSYFCHSIFYLTQKGFIKLHNLESLNSKYSATTDNLMPETTPVSSNPAQTQPQTVQGDSLKQRYNQLIAEIKSHQVKGENLQVANSSKFNLDDIPEEIVKAIWWVLKEIKKEYLATPNGEQVYFSIVPGEVLIIGQIPTVPSIEEQKQALRILQKIGAIKLDQYTHYVKMTGKSSFTGEPVINGVYLDILKPKFDEVYEETGNKVEPKKHEDKQIQLKTDYTQEDSSSSTDKVLECGSFKINLDQSTIQYKDGTPSEISTGINIVKLLILLIENKRVIPYTEIAQKLKLNCYHEGVTNKDVAREVQFLRRDLGDFLVKIGMSKTEIQGMFISKKNVGYKLRCSD